MPKSPMLEELRFCGQLVSEEDLKLVREIVSDFKFPRTELADTLCELLDWTRPNGKLKRVECLQFLEKLEEKGLLKLPERAKQGKGAKKKPKKTQQGDRQKELSCELSVVKPVLLERVENKEQRALWKELVDRYHYLGWRVPFGANVRYLIKVMNPVPRVVGCLQASSPAWRVQARDAWIGWDEETRKANLQKVVQQSRFLILPWVSIKGLASHVLSLANRQVPRDWEAMYATKVVLMETFVDQGRFRGTCYKAANWIEVGQTQGRGRMDREKRFDKGIKTVFLYPLGKRFRDELGLLA